jgi:Holliday junction resolvase RusA-like endonuclease
VTFTGGRRWRGKVAVSETTYPYILTIRQAPDARLSANKRSKRGGYYGREDATKTQRKDAGYEFQDQWIADPLSGELSLLVRVIWPRGKRGKLPDVDGLGSYVKPLLDAMQGIVVVNDDQFRRVAFEQQRADAVTARYYPQGCVQFVIETWREVPDVRSFHDALVHEGPMAGPWDHD